MAKEIKLKNLDFAVTEQMFAMNLDPSALYETNASEFYRKAMIGENSTRSLFRPIFGIKDRVKLGTALFDSVIKPGAEDFDPSDSTISQKTFEVCPIMVGTSVGIDDLEISFVSDSIGKGSANFSEPAAFMNFFYETLSATVAQEMELLTFQGDSSLTGDTFLRSCDGLEKTLGNATGTTKPSTASTVTSTNVIAKLTEARNKVSKAARHKADFVYIVAQNVWDALMDAVSENKMSGLYYVEAELLKFQGVRIVLADGASDNTIIATYLSNLLYISDLASDLNGYTIIDFMKTTLTRKIGVRTDAKISFGALVDSDVYIHLF